MIHLIHLTYAKIYPKLWYFYTSLKIIDLNIFRHRGTEFGFGSYKANYSKSLIKNESIPIFNFNQKDRNLLKLMIKSFQAL